MEYELVLVVLDPNTGVQKMAETIEAMRKLTGVVAVKTVNTLLVQTLAPAENG